MPESVLPTTNAICDVVTQPSFSFQLSGLTVNNLVSERDLRYVSVMLEPQHDKLLPTVPRLASSQDTVLQLYSLYTPPRFLHVALMLFITMFTFADDAMSTFFGCHLRFVFLSKNIFDVKKLLMSKNVFDV